MADTPGLRKRREEYETLRDAAEDGSSQARMRLDSARKALERQENVSKTRKLLNRVRGY